MVVRAKCHECCNNVTVIEQKQSKIIVRKLGTLLGIHLVTRGKSMVVIRLLRNSSKLFVRKLVTLLRIHLVSRGKVGLSLYSCAILSSFELL